MGRSYKMPLIIRTRKAGRFLGAWQVRAKYGHPGHGQPNAENLGKWRDAFNNSLLPGGPNDHLGLNYWLHEDLEIFDQNSGRVVATYRAPMFEVIPDSYLGRPGRSGGGQQYPKLNEI
jgi:hypothetical protein